MNQFNNIIWNFNPLKDFSLKKWLKDLLTELLQDAMDLSMNVCIIAGLIGIILYLFGWKKCKNVPFITWAIHLIIQILGGVLLG
jgi:hypothetical protein